MQRKIAGKWPYIILMAVIVVAIILVAVLGARNVNLAPVYGIVLTAGLVGITAIYVYETGRIAKANSRMAEEMEKTRFAAYRPILSIDNSSIQDLLPEQKIRIGLLGERGEFPYFWPCNISNVGGGPALDVKWLVHHGDKPLSWTASVIGKDSVVKNGPP